MKPYLIFAPDRQEMAAILSRMVFVLKRNGSAQIPMSMTKLAQLKECVDGDGTVQLLVCDATAIGVLPVVEQLRGRFAQMKLILLADSTVSPVSYIKPSILPTGLLWRPVQEDSIMQVLGEVLRGCGEEMPSAAPDTESCFAVESRGDVKRYAYRDILFFEARDKKLLLHLKRKEYAFLGTLEKLMEELPEGFLRVHKSFIVNRSRVRELRYGQNLLILDDDTQIPISRSYKAAVKAVFT